MHNYKGAPSYGPSVVFGTQELYNWIWIVRKLLKHQLS